MASLNSLNSLDNTIINGKEYNFYNIQKATEKLGVDIDKFPFGMKILLENLLRFEDGKDITVQTIENFVKWVSNKGKGDVELSYYPSRVLMQDFTGIPAIVDLAAMRDFVVKNGGNADTVNPLVPIDLVVDHSIQADYYGTSDALHKNSELEIGRNKERYRLFKWAQKSFNNMTIVPPEVGICHQINLEYLAKVVFEKDNLLYPDTVVGTDSHTVMINGLGVLGWGVGGIEAEAVSLGQAISLVQPEIIGVKLTGKTKEGITATDVVLTITQMLRKKGVVNKFVEFFGNGLDNLSLADRATIANMAPEYGATCGLFPIDDEVLKYLHLTGRSDERIAIVKEYAIANKMWRNDDIVAVYTDIMSLDLSTIEASVAGPKRPQDRIILKDVADNFNAECKTEIVNNNVLQDGSVVIAAITSCTNTSNPSVIIGAGLLAKKAVEMGLKVKPFVKTTLSPGSTVVGQYLIDSGLQEYLNQLGFFVAGYGCMTCIGNSGPLNPEIEAEIKSKNLNVTGVLSGNRNFEGRIHALVKSNYLASPPLVVAYSLLGSVRLDITKTDFGGGIFLKDLWPSNQEIADTIAKSVKRETFIIKYADLSGSDEWKKIEAPTGKNYEWDKSSYIANPPYFENIKKTTEVKIENARCLAMLGDSITTDHISPAGNIAENSPAAKYLNSFGITKKDFNSYGTRRGHHEVMMRGTFANVRIKNEMISLDGPLAIHLPSGTTDSIYDTAMRYIADKTPLVIVAGKEYGSGSSRDWAAKGQMLLGVKAVIVESFERIHRSNLVGMGVLPFEFTNGDTRKTLNLKGDEKFSFAIPTIDDILTNKTVNCTIIYADDSVKNIDLKCRIDTFYEAEYYKAGGVMQYVIGSIT